MIDNETRLIKPTNIRAFVKKIPAMTPSYSRGFSPSYCVRDTSCVIDQNIVSWVKLCLVNCVRDTRNIKYWVNKCLIKAPILR